MQVIEVIEIRKRVLGEEHPDTLTSIGNLVFTLKIQSRNHEAISLTKSYLKLRKQVLGLKHLDIQTSLEALHEWKDGEDSHERYRANHIVAINEI